MRYLVRAQKPTVQTMQLTKSRKLQLVGIAEPAKKVGEREILHVAKIVEENRLFIVEYTKQLMYTRSTEIQCRRGRPSAHGRVIRVCCSAAGGSPAAAAACSLQLLPLLTCELAYYS